MLNQNRNHNRQSLKRKEMTNPIATIVDCVCRHFLEKPKLFPGVTVPKNAKRVVQMHTDKLNIRGDFSFPCDQAIWKNGCSDSGYKLRQRAFEMFLSSDENKAQLAKAQFLTGTKIWIFPVEKVQVDNDRCAIFLQRKIVIRQLIRAVLCHSTHPYGKLNKNSEQLVWLRRASQNTNNVPQDLSLYRAHLIEDILQRVLEYSSWTLVTERESNAAKTGLGTPVLHLSAKCLNSKDLHDPLAIPPSKLTCATIKCGLVTDPLTAKVTKVKTDEYLRCRSNDMRLMAMHKYGVRVQNDESFNRLMRRLGSAAVTVDLMEVRFSSPVSIIRTGRGSTRGAAFILYNSARIETLLRTFEQRVSAGEYRALPPLDEVDLSLLDEEEEWQLVFGYIFAFPNLIERCLEGIEKGTCSIHLIVRFLGDFMAVFSVYYRRVHILIKEVREHLMPYVYARIYLVKAVREILNRSLALLYIEPVEFM